MVLTEGLKNTFCRNKQTNKQIHSEKNATKYRWNGDFFPIHRTYFKSSIVCFMFIDINKQTDFHLTSICSWSERNSTENSCYIMVFSTLAKNRSLCVHCSSLWLTKQARHMCNVSHIIFHMLFLCFFIVFFFISKIWNSFAIALLSNDKTEHNETGTSFEIQKRIQTETHFTKFLATNRLNPNERANFWHMHHMDGQRACIWIYFSFWSVCYRFLFFWTTECNIRQKQKLHKVHTY